MDNKIILLLVEDQDSDIEVFTDTAKYFYSEEEVKRTIAVLSCKTTSEAEEFLSKQHIDACVVDLKLKDGDKGEKLIDEIFEKFHLPTFVYTGTPSEINYPEQQPFFKIYKKGNREEINKILSEVDRLYVSGVTRVIQKELLFEDIQKFLPTIFWKHLPSSIDYWIDNNAPKSLQRYILNHVKEYLEYNEEGNFEQIDPAEVYITPPVTENLMTGNILFEEESDKMFLLMTPACDLVIRKEKCKAEKLVLVEFIKWDSLISLDKDLSEHDDKEKKSLLNKLKQLTRPARYYWMPNHHPINGYLLDFQSITNPHIKDIDQYTIIASIISPFMKDIVANFSYYYSRQGAPEWDYEASMKKCFEM